MRLTVIGRNPQDANIVLNSQYISNYHAEIIQLDNGDIFLVDKSTNGTYLNGTKLTPGKEVAIRRGDSILFADVPLDWSLIDEIRIPKDVKQIMSIGSHYMNTINVQGPNVSRFHATIRKMADGKWYICDHSKNGTTVNGVRIQKDRYVRIKKGDEISCAGVPIQNPIPGPDFQFKWVACIVAVAACIFGLSLIEWPWSPEKLTRTYNPTVAWMRTYYHFKVSCSGIDLNNYMDTEFTLDEKQRIDFNERSYAEATGFFIGDEGHIVTNRHAARPWENQPGRSTNNTNTLIEYAEAQIRQYLLESYYAEKILPHIHTLKVEGVVDGTIVIPSGSYYDSDNATNCIEVACGTLEEDLALFKVTHRLMANEIVSIPYKKIKTTDVQLGSKVYTIGYPFSLMLQDYTKKPLQPYFADGVVSHTNFSNVQFGLTATSFEGASGSPVFDNYGNLVGILNQGVGISQGYNYAIKGEYLEKLLRQAKLIK